MFLVVATPTEPPSFLLGLSGSVAAQDQQQESADKKVDREKKRQQGRGKKDDANQEESKKGKGKGKKNAGQRTDEQAGGKSTAGERGGNRKKTTEERVGGRKKGALESTDRAASDQERPSLSGTDVVKDPPPPASTQAPRKVVEIPPLDEVSDQDSRTNSSSDQDAAADKAYSKRTRRQFDQDLKAATFQKADLVELAAEERLYRERQAVIRRLDVLASEAGNEKRLRALEQIAEAENQRHLRVLAQFERRLGKDRLAQALKLVQRRPRSRG